MNDNNDHLDDRTAVIATVPDIQLERHVIGRDYEVAPFAVAPKPNKRVRRVLTLIVTTVIGLAAGAYYLWFVAPYESTDDAFIEGRLKPVVPQVAGRVEKVLVRDYQFVNAGDLLVQIDPSYYVAKLDQARGNLASANSRLTLANAQFALDQAKVDDAKANVVPADVEAKRAVADLMHYQSLGTDVVSKNQLDIAARQARSTATQLQVARDREFAAEAQAILDKANIESTAIEVKRSEAAVRQAELDLSYTLVEAHESGLVTHQTVHSDSYVQAGQSMMSIMPDGLWVVANFKETQLAYMRPGQSVEIKVDAHPGRKLRGHVDSIQKGMGAQFSLLPPEKGGGNYVKIVQRVPFKILLDETPDDRLALDPGMSVEPKVRVK